MELELCIFLAWDVLGCGFSFSKELLLEIVGD